MPKYLDDTGLATNIQIAKDTFMPKMTVDSSPTANSTNLVTSGGVKTAVDAKQDTISDLATIRSGAALGATALQSYTETDPTVPAWAKASTKPTYTAAEVGALPSTTTIPTKTSNLTNDSGFQSLAYTAISSASSSKTLAWNTIYQWTVNPTSISLTLPSAPSDSRGEIVLKFTTGSTAPTVTWPSGLKWANGEEITPEASTTYEFSIGYDMMGGWTIVGCGFSAAS